MSFEAGILKEDENKKKEARSKLEEREKRKQVIEQQKLKEQIRTNIQTDENLLDLKELIEKGLVSEQIVEKIKKGERIGDEGVEEIFAKIDEIEDIKDIDKYVPAELRITKEEYLAARSNNQERQEVINKLNNTLGILSKKVSGDNKNQGSINLFSGYISILDNNMIRIQENTIDIKDDLVSINKKINPGVEKSWWQKFLEELKNIFK